MYKSVISGDIISSTSLLVKDRELLEQSLTALLEELKNKFDVFGRVIKGDYLEVVVPKPQNALRVALAIKSFVKSVSITNASKYKKSSRVQLFKTYGIRLAIGYAELTRFNPTKGIIDGEAIYLSGRLINGLSSFGKDRVVIKNTLYFISNNESLNESFESLFALIDTLINKATPRQSEVLYLKLLFNNETTIAAKLNIGQSVVNQHSTSLGWNSIEKAVNYFNKTISNS